MKNTKYILRLDFFENNWIQVRDGDPACQVLFHRHYSKYHYKDGRRQHRFVGPGSRIVLVTHDGRAMFVWRKEMFRKDDQTGICCAVFRNEGYVKSSQLILEAEQIAMKRWPGERLYTFVNPEKINSKNPGYCFKVCGWKTCGKTKKGLIILEKLNDNEQKK